MNYKLVINILGKTLFICGLLLCIPLGISFIYNETHLWQSFVYPIVGLFLAGLIMILIKPEDKTILAKEGIIIVALTWVILSLVGAVPFVVSGAIPNYVDALFETVSGLTTTGSSVLSNVEALPKCLLFWRSFTHFIGGMGVLVFVLAILPKSSGSMHIYRAESPGPTSSKLVSKMSFTARILYAIYVVLTLIQIIFYLCGGMPLFDSVLIGFSVAGTGGFAITNNGMAAYSNYAQIVATVFMFLFSINFNLYYMILIGNVKKTVKSEEFITFTLMIVAAITMIAINLVVSCKQVYSSFGLALKDAAFHVTSISSTTGLSNNVDTDAWPTLAKSVLMFLMICGAMAGSTGGGMKMARFVILFKAGINDIKKMIRPREVTTVKFEGEVLSQETVRNTYTFLSLWLALICLSAFILSFDGFDLLTNISTAFACIGNIGPGFNEVGVLKNYANFSGFSKVYLSLLMLAGRLELFPIFIMFQPSTWGKN